MTLPALVDQVRDLSERREKARRDAPGVAPRFYDLKVVIDLTSLSKSTLYKMMAEEPPEFPRPVSLSARRVGWYSPAVDQWLECRNSAAQAALPGIGTAGKRP